MPKIYKPFTDHTSSEMFARIYLMKAGQFARESDSLSLHMRLFFLGLQRISNRGHAPFKAGEIQQLLQSKVGRPYGEKQIRNEIKRLTKDGLISPLSNIRCLLYPMELISLKTEKKNAAKCDEHGTHSSWSGYNNDWAPDYLPEAPMVEPIIPQIPVGDDISEWHSDFSSVEDGTYGSY